jgi:ferredoxin
MARGTVPVRAARLLHPRAGLDAIVTALAADGYRVIGPRLRDGVITYADVASGDDLPTGVTVEQSPGRWRTGADGGPSRFAYTPGAASLKEFVLPAHQEVLRVRRTDGSFAATSPAPSERALAFVGVRDCDVRALAVLDRVELDPRHPDPRYAARRAGAFVVAATCATPAATCWCTTTGGGPEPGDGADLRLTELTELTEPGDDGHVLLAEALTDRGEALLARLPAEAGAPATAADRRRADAVVRRAVELLPVRLPTADLPALLVGTELDPHWDDVAARCLSCGNCTMVCPTCFCVTFADSTELGSDDVVRTQEWASCFQLDHSNLGGHPVRATTANRYRQWLTHKLATWPAQFGTTGCVGCGRCTTWCPAGIDLPAEAEVLCAAIDARGSA